MWLTVPHCWTSFRDELVLAVEEQNAELLDLLIRHGRLQIADQRLRAAEHGTVAHPSFGHTAGDFADKAQECDVAGNEPKGTKL